MRNALGTPLELIEERLSIDTRGFKITENEKIQKIASHFRCIMEALGLDLTDDSLKDTPQRVAKMYVTETFQGLNPNSFPRISLFDNTSGYHEMLVEKDIEVYSCCEHHFLPFIGKAHVAYMPDKKIIGLSKINRIVRHFCKRPQLQERLTTDIAACLKEVLQTEDIAVFIEASHLCVASRGVEDTRSTTVTTHLGGRFKEEQNKSSFYASFRH